MLFTWRLTVFKLVVISDFKQESLQIKAQPKLHKCIHDKSLTVGDFKEQRLTS